MKFRNLFNIVGAFVFMCFLWSSFLSNEVYAGFATLSGNANFLSSEFTSTVGGITTTSEFESETYRLNASKRLTRVLGITGSGTHTVRRANGVEDSTTSPVVSLSFRPPALYVFNFNYNRSQTYPTDRIGLIVSSLNLRFYLPVGEKFPSLNVSYTRSTNEDDRDPHFLDSVNDRISVSSGYGIDILGEKLNISYGLNRSTSQDNITDLKFTNFTNNLGISWGQKYFEDKLTTTYNLSGNWSTDTHESLSNPQQFESVVPPSQGLADRGAVPETFPVANDTEITNNDNLNTITVMAAPLGLSDPAIGADWHFGLDFGVSRSIHKLNLYILIPSGADTTTFEGEKATIMSNLGWKVYTSADNSSWGPLGGIPVTPAIVLVGTSGGNTVYRLEFNFGVLSDRYIQLYNGAFSGAAYFIGVSEIEAFTYINQQLSQKEKVGRSGNSFAFSVNYKHSSRLSLRYSLSLFSSKTDIFKGSKGTSHSFNTRYSASSKIKLSLALSQSNSENLEAKSESQFNSTSVSLSYKPLRTLTTSLNSSFTDTSQNGKKTGSSSTVNLSASALLYDGISMGTALRLISGESNATKATFETTNFSWNFRLTPWKPMQIVYSVSESDSTFKSIKGTRKTSSESANASLSIRFTETIFFSAGFAIEPTDASRYSLSWRLLPRINLSGSYSDNDFSSATSFTAYWRVMNRISLSFTQSATEKKNASKDTTEVTSLAANFRF